MSVNKTCLEKDSLGLNNLEIKPVILVPNNNENYNKLELFSSVSKNENNSNKVKSNIQESNSKPPKKTLNNHVIEFPDFQTIYKNLSPNERYERRQNNIYVNPRDFKTKKNDSPNFYKPGNKSLQSSISPKNTSVHKASEEEVKRLEEKTTNVQVKTRNNSNENMNTLKTSNLTTNEDYTKVYNLVLDTKVAFHLTEFLRGELRRFYFDNYPVTELEELSELVNSESKKIKNLSNNLNKLCETLDTYIKVIKNKISPTKRSQNECKHQHILDGAFIPRRSNFYGRNQSDIENPIIMRTLNNEGSPKLKKISDDMVNKSKEQTKYKTMDAENNYQLLKTPENARKDTDFYDYCDNLNETLTASKNNDIFTEERSIIDGIHQKNDSLGQNKHNNQILNKKVKNHNLSVDQRKVFESNSDQIGAWSNNFHNNTFGTYMNHQTEKGKYTVFDKDHTNIFKTEQKKSSNIEQVNVRQFSLQNETGNNIDSNQRNLDKHNKILLNSSYEDSSLYANNPSLSLNNSIDNNNLKAGKNFYASGFGNKSSLLTHSSKENITGIRKSNSKNKEKKRSIKKKIRESMILRKNKQPKEEKIFREVKDDDTFFFEFCGFQCISQLEKVGNETTLNMIYKYCPPKSIKKSPFASTDCFDGDIKLLSFSNYEKLINGESTFVVVHDLINWGVGRNIHEAEMITNDIIRIDRSRKWDVIRKGGNVDTGKQELDRRKERIYNSPNTSQRKILGYEENINHEPRTDYNNKDEMKNNFGDYGKKIMNNIRRKSMISIESNNQTKNAIDNNLFSRNAVKLTGNLVFNLNVFRDKIDLVEFNVNKNQAQDHLTNSDKNSTIIFDNDGKRNLTRIRAMSIDENLSINNKKNEVKAFIVSNKAINNVNKNKMLLKQKHELYKNYLERSIDINNDLTASQIDLQNSQTPTKQNNSNIMIDGHSQSVIMERNKGHSMGYNSKYPIVKETIQKSIDHCRKNFEDRKNKFLEQNLDDHYFQNNQTIFDKSFNENKINQSNFNQNMNKSHYPWRAFAIDSQQDFDNEPRNLNQKNRIQSAHKPIQNNIKSNSRKDKKYQISDMNNKVNYLGLSKKIKNISAKKNNKSVLETRPESSKEKPQGNKVDIKELITHSKKERYNRNTKGYIKNNKNSIQVKEITYDHKNQKNDSLSTYLNSTHIIPEFIESINDDPIRKETYKEQVGGQLKTIQQLKEFVSREVGVTIQGYLASHKSKSSKGNSENQKGNQVDEKNKSYSSQESYQISKV